MPLSIFHKYEMQYSLLMPEETKFASTFIMIDRLLKVKRGLQQSVVDPQWVEYVQMLKDNPKKKVHARTLSHFLKTNILLSHFWTRCTNFGN